MAMKKKNEVRRKNINVKNENIDILAPWKSVDQNRSIILPTTAMDKAAFFQCVVGIAPYNPKSKLPLC